MVDEGHVLFLLGKLKKFQSCGQYVDCTIRATDGEIQCHLILLSSVCRHNEMQIKVTDSNKRHVIPVKTSVKNISGFLALLYDSSVLPLQECSKNLISTANLLGIVIPHPANGTIKADDFATRFSKQRNIALGRQLNEMRSKSLSDITLIIERQKFFCHKVILASFSAYFDAMFSTDLREIHQQEICIHYIEKHIFKLILDFIYTGANILTVENIQQVLLAVSYLQIPALQGQCERFMIRHIEINNCIDITKLGDTIGSEYLLKKGVHFLCQYFNRVCKNPEFNTLNKNIMVRILQSNQINSENEYSVLQKFLCWMKHQTKDLEPLDILKHFRFSLILDEELRQALENEVIKNSRECVKYINNAIKSKTGKNEQNRAFETEEMMVVMWTSSYNPGLHLLCFSFVSNLWYQLPGLPKHTTGNSYGACSDAEDIYICGGTANPHSFYHFNFAASKWNKLGPIEYKYGRADHGMVVNDRSVYLIGGTQDQITIWPFVDRYNKKTRSMDRIGNLSIAVSNPSCAVFEDSIIIFGGNKSFGEYISSIQRFDLNTNSCTSYSKLPTMCSYSGVVINEDVVYIVGPRGDVVLYEHGKDPVILGSIHKQTIFGFGTVFYQGKVYLLGGKSDRFESIETRCFDVYTKTTCSTNRNMKIPAKKESNQYFCTIHRIRKSLLDQENICQSS